MHSVGAPAHQVQRARVPLCKSVPSTHALRQLDLIRRLTLVHDHAVVAAPTRVLWPARIDDNHVPKPRGKPRGARPRGAPWRARRGSAVGTRFASGAGGSGRGGRDLNRGQLRGRRPPGFDFVTGALGCHVGGHVELHLEHPRREFPQQRTDFNGRLRAQLALQRA